MQASERLKQWLRRSKMNQRQAAEELGFHYTHFNQILNGRRRPGVRNAVRIEELTGIPVRSWLPTRVLRTRATDPAKDDAGNVGVE